MTDKLVVSACILYNILREAKVLAPGQKHVDDPLSLPTENLISLVNRNVRAQTNPIQIGTRKVEKLLQSIRGY